MPRAAPALPMLAASRAASEMGRGGSGMLTQLGKKGLSASLITSAQELRGRGAPGAGAS